MSRLVSENRASRSNTLQGSVLPPCRSPTASVGSGRGCVEPHISTITEGCGQNGNCSLNIASPDGPSIMVATAQRRRCTKMRGIAWSLKCSTSETRPKRAVTKEGNPSCSSQMCVLPKCLVFLLVANPKFLLRVENKRPM
jgi:hypothetical protein